MNDRRKNKRRLVDGFDVEEKGITSKARVKESEVEENVYKARYGRREMRQSIAGGSKT